MPLTLTYTTDTLRLSDIPSLVNGLTDLMLSAHGLSDHPIMKPNITATVHELSLARTFSGGKEAPGIWVEWKVPSFAFAAAETQLPFCRAATDLLHAATQGRLSRRSIYVNVVHAVDGAWNFNGEPLSNSEILAALRP